MNQLEIRVASPGDATLILLLMREFYGHFDDLRFDEVNTTRALNQLLANREKGVVLTGHLDNEPIGYLALVFSHSLELFGSVAWIDEFCVRQQHRSKGYGTAMLRHAEDSCRGSDVKVILLELDRTNESGQALYSRVGFGPRSLYETYIKVL